MLYSDSGPQRRPLLHELVGDEVLARDATVTYCHSRTVDWVRTVAEADIVIAAVVGPN